MINTMLNKTITFLFLFFYMQKLVKSLESDEEIELKNNCKCVPYFQCNENNAILKNGEDILDVRMQIKRILCNSNPNGIIQYCCQDPAVNNRAAMNLDSERKCGTRSPTFDERFGDKSSPTEVGDFPWMAAVYEKEKFICTGTLIHPKVILTTAHYVLRVKNKNSIRVVVNGESELNKKIPEDERFVEEIISRPDYVEKDLYNDIALLILNEPIKMDYRINTICIPRGLENFEGMSCQAAGWNKLDMTPLKKVDLPYISHDKCQSMFREYTDLGRNFVLHESFICAGGEKGKDSCRGDGGSPLMCEKDGVTYQVGIVSWGKGCNLENVPGAYTSVPHYMDWMDSELLKREIIIL